jgi:hypothetical protein
MEFERILIRNTEHKSKSRSFLVRQKIILIELVVSYFTLRFTRIFHYVVIFVSVHTCRKILKSHLSCRQGIDNCFRKVTKVKHEISSLPGG